MQKKLVALFLAVSLVINPIHCYAGVWKLLVGIGLAGGGIFLTTDGFSKVVDKEWDEKIDVEEWDFLYYEYIEAYYPPTRQTFPTEHYYNDPDPSTIVYRWDTEEEYESIGCLIYKQLYYNHHSKDILEHRVTHKTKSVGEGIIGVGMTGTGIYLIVDYLIDYNKLKKEAGIEIKVGKRADTTYLLCCKNF